MDEEIIPVVIDNSSYQMRFGMGGNDVPSAEFRTVVGTTCNIDPKIKLIYSASGEYLYGEAALFGGCTNLSYPLNAGSGYFTYLADLIKNSFKLGRFNSYLETRL